MKRSVMQRKLEGI